jgi:uridylate kinase
MQETIVISLGGSLIVPNQVDVDFLRDFKTLIFEQIKRGKKFAIITGGGKTCRNYQAAAREISPLSNSDLDWLGIYATRFNAELLRLILGEENTEKEIIINPNLPIDFKKNIVLGAGWEPGNSTDLDAVLIAKNLGAKKVINMSNIDYVYDFDPKKNPEAKRFEKLSWAEYRKLIPKEWNPGLNSPFDPVASELAEGEGLEVIIMNGKPISNLLNCLKGEKFLGTIIS